MTEDSRYIIAFLLRDDAVRYHQNLVDQVSIRFNLRRINTPSHITLKDSFYCSDTAEVEQVIQQAISDIRVHGRIAIDGISNFGDEIFYMVANLDQKARSIYERLFNGLKTLRWLQWDQYDLLDRNFHITITNKSSDINFREIQSYLSQYNPKFIVPFNNIAILRKLAEEHRWIVYKEFNF